MSPPRLRRRLLPVAATTFVVGVVPFAPAHAGPVEELWASTEIYIDNGEGEFDGQTYGFRDRWIAKSYGTLDLVVNPQSLGIDYDDSVTVHGVQHGNEVWWDFDVPLTGVQVDAFTRLRRVEGHIVTRVDYVSGLAGLSCAGGSCPYDLRVIADRSRSWVRIHGTTFWSEWSRDASPSLEAFSGNERAVLDSVAFEGPREGICQRSEGRSYSGRVVLASPVSTPTWIDVSSSDGTIIANQRVRIAPGATTGSFFFSVPANYGGSMIVLAASDGTIVRRILNVGDPSYCLPWNMRFMLEDIEAQLDCRGCLLDAQFASNGAALAFLQDGYFHRDAEGWWTHLDDYVGFGLEDPIISDVGDLVGRIGEDTAIIDGSDPWGEPTIVERFAPTALTNYGVIYGRAYNAGEPAFVSNGHAWGLNLPNYSKVLAANVGAAVGYRYTEQGTTATVLTEYANDMYFGGYPSRAVGINAAGDVVGTFGLDEDYTYGFVLRSGADQPSYVDSHEPQLGVEAVGISDAGVVVYNVRDFGGESLGAGLFSPETGPVPLQEVLYDLDADVEVWEVLRTNPSFDLVVRGAIDGEPSVFVLRSVGGEN